VFWFFLQLTFVRGTFVQVAGQVFSGIPDASTDQSTGQLHTGVQIGEVET